MRFVQDNLYPLLATLALTFAIVFWFGAPNPPPIKAQTLIAEPWSLPKEAEHDAKKPLDVINARNLWGIVATNAPKEPEWHVLGIVRSGLDRFILLAFEGKPIEMLKAGDALPDGVKIMQIEKDRFFVMTPDKKKLAFGIYKNEPAK